MCNSLEKPFKKIPESGIGYKLFNISHHKKEYVLGYINDFKFEKNKWYNWSKRISYEDGFCFFIDIEDARIYKNSYDNQTGIYKIKYSGGLGKKHLENDICLCKKFKILERVRL